jgi:pyrimidine operon attenuation protein / uracil phosphoribosyltransferase
MSAVPLMDAVALDRALTRMAHEIVEQNPQADTLAFIGIRTNGAPLARRLAAKVGAICGHAMPVGELDIGMHRDDLGLRAELPVVKPSEIPYDVTDKTIVLVDDVLFTGRSIRAALDALMDLGRPRRIQLAVLVDRGHRELPIRPDFVGKNVPSAPRERIRVHLAELTGHDEVLLEK